MNLHEYQDKEVTKKNHFVSADSKGHDFGCYGQQGSKGLPEKTKAGALGSAPDKQAPALQARLST
jgi:hypothetical protein